MRKWSERLAWEKNVMRSSSTLMKCRSWNTNWLKIIGNYSLEFGNCSKESTQVLEPLSSASRSMLFCVKHFRSISVSETIQRNWHSISFHNLSFTSFISCFFLDCFWDHVMWHMTWYNKNILRKVLNFKAFLFVVTKVNNDFGWNFISLLFPANQRVFATNSVSSTVRLHSATLLLHEFPTVIRSKKLTYWISRP